MRFRLKPVNNCQRISFSISLSLMQSTRKNVIETKEI